MQVDFSNNYFELFDLPAVFSIDEQQLSTRFRSLQSVLHPDKFAAAAEAERRWSMQAASFVNEAYQTLSKPMARAVYILSLNGISLDEETDTHMSPMFLMEQMELREALADAPDGADPYAALDNITAQLRAGVSESKEAFMAATGNENWSEARTVVRQWQFLDKLSREVVEQEARLDVV